MIQTENQAPPKQELDFDLVKIWPQRRYTIPAELEARIARVLKTEFKLELTDSAKIAECIQRLSNHYIRSPKGATPWSQTWCQIAYLAYYLPLNYLRAQAVVDEGKDTGFFDPYQNIIDFGSGLGSATLPFARGLKQFFFIESSLEAQRLHHLLFRDMYSLGNWIQLPPPYVPEKSLAIFSYSFTELSEFPQWARQCESIMLIEPSTMDDGRRLLNLREKFILDGWSIWGPCTHQGHCPLLQQSKHDWCHDRIHFDQPEWFQKIEARLPMKNRTLTMSYLLISKRPAVYNPKVARTVGDMMKEKGKTRQLICRGPIREFFTWMHKETGLPAEIPRGVLIDVPETYEIKSNEIRLRPTDRAAAIREDKPQLLI